MAVPAVVHVVSATTPPADKVSPGIAGFLVVFVLALATVVLIRSMVGHLRKVRYSPGPDGAEGETPAAAVTPVSRGGPDIPEAPSAPDATDGQGAEGGAPPPSR